MLKKEFRQSLQYKFLKDISIILFVGTCVLSAVIALHVEKTLKNALTSKGLSLASSIANRNENALIMNGSTQLNTVYSELNTDEEIIYTVIRDSKDKILTSQFESINYKWPGLELYPSESCQKTTSCRILSQSSKNKWLSEKSPFPIMMGADTLGKVSIGMSDHKIRKQIMETVLFVIAS